MGTVSAIGPNRPSLENVLTTLEMAKDLAIEGHANRCVVILLHQSDNRYDHRYVNAGMNTSEIVALLEIQKADVIQNMG